MERDMDLENYIIHKTSTILESLEIIDLRVGVSKNTTMGQLMRVSLRVV